MLEQLLSKGEVPDPPRLNVSDGDITISNTGNRSYLIPNGVYRVTVEWAGAGGGGGGGTGNGGFRNASGGNGGRGARRTTTIDVDPGDRLYFNIGEGGSAGFAGTFRGHGRPGGDGGQTTFSYLTSYTPSGGGGGGQGGNEQTGVRGAAGTNASPTGGALGGSGGSPQQSGSPGDHGWARIRWSKQV